MSLSSILNKRWEAGSPLLMPVILLSLLIACPSPSLEAANPKKELSEIQKKLKQKKKKIKEVRKKEKSILSELDSLDKNIKKNQAELKRYSKEIAQSEARLKKLSKDINSLGSNLSARETYLRKRLETLYKQQYGGNALLLMSSNDYNDLIKKSKYISMLAYHDSSVLHQYKSSIKEQKDKKNSIEDLQKKLKINKETASKRKRELRSGKARKDKLLATVRSKRSSYERAIKEMEQSSKELREMMKKLAKKKVPKAVVGKGFSTQKGRLNWPISGKIIVPYGQYNDPKFNIKVFKNGVEIQSSLGAQPKAVAGGRVVYADWFKGYGLLLILNHGGGYHSLYGHLTEIFHKPGDIIRRGTAIGKIGESRLLNVPTLYFEIRHKGKPVNPTQWLAKK
jgi:septal ring factor EnvC (AmiA/AmiB activator)